jgi:hypothetical protein
LLPRCHRSRDAGRGHQRWWPVAAPSVSAFKFEGRPGGRIKDIKLLSLSCRRIAANREDFWG